MSDQLASDIHALRDHIAEVGWHQGSYYADHDGEPVINPPLPGESVSCCIEGGVRVIARGRVRTVTDHLIEQIAARGDVEIAWESFLDQNESFQVAIRPDGTSVNPVPYFNDHVLRSQAEVLEFLDKAALTAEEKA